MLLSCIHGQNILFSLKQTFCLITHSPICLRSYLWHARRLSCPNYSFSRLLIMTWPLTFLELLESYCPCCHDYLLKLPSHSLRLGLLIWAVFRSYWLSSILWHLISKLYSMPMNMIWESIPYQHILGNIQSLLIDKKFHFPIISTSHTKGISNNYIEYGRKLFNWYVFLSQIKIFLCPNIQNINRQIFPLKGLSKVSLWHLNCPTGIT